MPYRAIPSFSLSDSRAPRASFPVRLHPVFLVVAAEPAHQLRLRIDRRCRDRRAVHDGVDSHRTRVDRSLSLGSAREIHPVLHHAPSSFVLQALLRCRSARMNTPPDCRFDGWPPLTPSCCQELKSPGISVSGCSDPIPEFRGIRAAVLACPSPCTWPYRVSSAVPKIGSSRRGADVADPEPRAVFDRGYR